MEAWGRSIYPASTPDLPPPAAETGVNAPHVSPPSTCRGANGDIADSKRLNGRQSVRSRLHASFFVSCRGSFHGNRFINEHKCTARQCCDNGWYVRWFRRALKPWLYHYRKSCQCCTSSDNSNTYEYRYSFSRQPGGKSTNAPDEEACQSSQRQVFVDALDRSLDLSAECQTEIVIQTASQLRLR